MDGRLNKLDQISEAMVIILVRGKRYQRYEQFGYNRRNYSNKYTARDEIITLERGTFNPRNIVSKVWNITWIKDGNEWFFDLVRSLQRAKSANYCI